LLKAKHGALPMNQLFSKNDLKGCGG